MRCLGSYWLYGARFNPAIYYLQYFLLHLLLDISFENHWYEHIKAIWLKNYI